MELDVPVKHLQVKKRTGEKENKVKLMCIELSETGIIK